MKKYYTRLLFSFCIFLFNASSIRLFSQTTVQIGTGTDVSGTTLYSPVYRSSAGSSIGYVRSNILFTQAELAAAGITAGSTITALQFNKMSEANFLIPARFDMYMGNTTRTSFPTSAPWLTWDEIETTHSMVYTNGAFNVPFTTGWVLFNITPFTYTGGSLEIATHLAMQSGSTGATGPFQWQYTSTVPSNLVAAGTAGTFAPSNLNATTAANKFRPNTKLTFTSNALPLTLINFKAARSSNNVSVRWSTESEGNVDRFEVERSSNSKDYTHIGSVVSHKSSAVTYAYSFTDTSVPQNIIGNRGLYYRLKMIDKDGSFRYSSVVIVKSTATTAIQVYPNPFAQHVHVKVFMEKAGQVAVALKDLNGKALKQWSMFVEKGESIISLDDINRLPKGTYLLKVSAAETTHVIKLVR